MGFLDRVKASLARRSAARRRAAIGAKPDDAGARHDLVYRMVLVTSGPLKAERITVGLYGRERVRIWIGAPPALAPADGEVPLSERAPTPAAAARETITFPAGRYGGDNRIGAGRRPDPRVSGQIRVPPAAQPTYRGVDAQHTWWVRAVVEIPLGADIVEEIEIVVHSDTISGRLSALIA